VCLCSLAALVGLGTVQCKELVQHVTSQTARCAFNRISGYLWGLCGCSLALWSEILDSIQSTGHMSRTLRVKSMGWRRRLECSYSLDRVCTRLR
jgi:hypothetical protein